jgi:hypothetical protein
MNRRGRGEKRHESWIRAVLLWNSMTAAVHELLEWTSVWIGTGLVMAVVAMRVEAANALQGQWDERFGFPDFNRTVYAVAVAPSGVYVGGAFGGNPQWLLQLERMARWDGAAWSSVGTGIWNVGQQASVQDMVFVGDELFGMCSRTTTSSPWKPRTASE